MPTQEFTPKANLRIDPNHRPKIKNLAGQKLKRWFVFGYAGHIKGGQNYWLCRCDCGNWKTVAHNLLLSGDSGSCGCLQHEKSISCNTTHGMKKDPLYGLWKGMRTRCLNPNISNAHLYSKKGVSFCDRWNDFALFKQDVGDRPSPEYSLERVNGDGNYEPGNVIWATAKQQANNTTRNRFITANGETHTMVQWSEIRSIAYDKLKTRLNLGWPPEEALEFAPHKMGDRWASRRKVLQTKD